MLSDLEGWPGRVESVDVVELLTAGPIGRGSLVRLKQPKLPVGHLGHHRLGRASVLRVAAGSGLFYKDLTNRYMGLEAAGMKRAAEAP